MGNKDFSDEEIARAVLDRLEDMGLTSLRPMAEEAPVSRGTLSRWKKGDYEMWPETREKCRAWLGATPARKGAGYSEGVRDAIRVLRREVTSALDRATRTLEELGGLSQEDAREVSRSARETVDSLDPDDLEKHA